MNARRIAILVCAGLLATSAAACIIGPKHEDPDTIAPGAPLDGAVTDTNTGPSGETGFNADTAPAETPTPPPSDGAADTGLADTLDGAADGDASDAPDAPDAADAKDADAAEVADAVDDGEVGG